MVAIGALDEVAVGVLVVLVMLGIVVVNRTLLGALVQLPFGIGDWVARSASLLLVGVYNAVLPLATVALGAPSALIRNLTGTQWRVWDQLGSLAQASGEMGRAIVGSVVPRYFNAAIAFTIAQVLRTVAYAQALHAQALAYTQAIGQRDVAYAQALHVQALAYAQQIGARDVQYAQALNAQAVRFTEAVGQRDIAYTQQAEAQALAYATAVGAGVLRWAEGAFERNLEFERQLYGQGLRFSEQLSQLDRAYARAIGAQAVAVSGVATAAVAASVAAIEDSPCMRACGVLGDLGQLLQGLEGMGALALLFTLAEAFVRDPDGTGRELDQVVGQPARELLSGAAHELGVS